MKRRYILRALSAVLFVSLLLLVSCSKSKKEPNEHAAEQPEKKRIEVTEEALKKSGIQIEVAGPAVLKKTLKLNGKITPNEEHMVHVSPRFPGIVKSIAKRLGGVVKTGETFAVIESNESLQPYEVKSEIDGTIIKRDIALGEFVDTSKTIFIVADLSNVWVDFSVYRHESENLRVGQKVLIQPNESADKIESTISYISPFGLENTQTTLARAVVPNDNGQFRPGLFINSAAAGFSPLETEQRIAFPVETAMAGLPRLDFTRSLSRYGLSQVTVIFKDGTDIYFARQLISERITQIKDELPPGVTIQMGPISTALGEVYMWSVEAKEGAKNEQGQPYTSTDLRTIQEWIVKPQLRNVPGVIEINSIGGYEKQYDVTPRPERLVSYGLSFRDVMDALMRNNANVSAGYIERNGEQYLIRMRG